MPYSYAVMLVPAVQKHG